MDFFRPVIEKLPDCWKAVVDNGGEYILVKVHVFCWLKRNKFRIQQKRRELRRQSNIFSVYYMCKWVYQQIIMDHY